MIVDGKNMVLGRLATRIAKAALKGEQIDVINAEQIVITGKKEVILADYNQRLQRGHPYAGPFFQKREDFFVKKAIVGMLPHKQEKGRLAAKRIKCHIGVPEQFKGKETTRFDQCDVMTTQSFKYMTVGQLCKHLGRT